jgi:chromosome partitioning protein
LGLDPYNLDLSTHTIIMQDEATLGDIVHSLGERMWLLPASVALGAAEFSLANLPNRTQRLSRGLDDGRELVDFILIDTPPSLGLLTVNALCAADEVLIPVECHYLAMRGVRALIETIWLIQKRLHPGLKILGILPTMYQSESIHCLKVTRDLRAVFKEQVFQTVIALDEAAMLAPTARTSVLKFESTSPAAMGYRHLAEEVLNKQPG